MIVGIYCDIERNHLVNHNEGVGYCKRGIVNIQLVRDACSYNVPLYISASRK